MFMFKKKLQLQFQQQQQQQQSQLQLQYWLLLRQPRLQVQQQVWKSDLGMEGTVTLTF